MKRYFVFILFMLTLCMFFVVCGGSKPEMFKPGMIAEDELDPVVWGKLFPLHYESWKSTSVPKPKDKSVYKKGFDTDKLLYDKLNELPFLALLYNGWGFGIEYNEPRGHDFAIQDLVDIDQSRTKPGGVCFACKSPVHKSFTKKFGMQYLAAPFDEAHKMIPENLQRMGPSCADCHKPSDLSLALNKDHLENGLKLIGKTKITRQDNRSLTCAQCHITYYVPRTQDKKVNGDVTLPWSGGKWGDISIETIIKNLLVDYQRLEWKQAVTGFDMPFIRHPEFELYTKGSTHFNAGLSCADCHMPYERVGSYKISNHDVTSPLKQDLVSCAQCHPDSADWLKEQILVTQKRTLSLMVRAGYANATAAKLFEMLHKSQAAGTKFDQNIYAKAKESYMQGFLRLNFVAAENSVGFHNATESARILGDSLAYASKTEIMLRQMLVKAGVNVPEKINLELNKYLSNRGKHKLNFRPYEEFKDPYGTQDYFTPKDVKGI